MTSPAFTESVRKNQAHKCSLPRCEVGRKGISLWCRAHTHQAVKYGHPLARPLSSKLWATHRKEVSELLQKNATHKGQLQALEWVGGLMAQATHNEGAYPGAQELARLARHSVKPIDILTELAACTMYLEANPRAVPDDRSWDYALSAAIFKVAPRARRTTRKPGTPWSASNPAKGGTTYAPKARRSALAYVGRHLRVTFAGLLANVITSIKSREVQRLAFEAELSRPFLVI